MGFLIFLDLERLREVYIYRKPIQFHALGEEQDETEIVSDNAR